jgi:hypothetical protein
MSNEVNGLHEPIAVLDTVGTGVVVEDLEHGLRRLVFYMPHGNERHICAKIVVPAACLIAISEIVGQHAQQVVENLLTLVPKANNHTG